MTELQGPPGGLVLHLQSALITMKKKQNPKSSETVTFCTCVALYRVQPLRCVALRLVRFPQRLRAAANGGGGS